MAGNEMESNQARFAHDELIKALQDAAINNEDDNDVMTSIQLADALGISQRIVLSRLRQLIGDNIIEPAPKRIVNIIGRHTTTMGYRLKI